MRQGRALCYSEVYSVSTTATFRPAYPTSQVANSRHATDGTTATPITISHEKIRIGAHNDTG